MAIRDTEPLIRLTPSGRRAVLACVDELPDVYQSALRLYYWLGASVSEIAVMLDALGNHHLRIAAA